jgi:hypothetical protein
MTVVSSHDRCLAPDGAPGDVTLPDEHGQRSRMRSATSSFADTAGAWHRTWLKEPRRD